MSKKPWQSFDNRNKTVILINDFIVLFKIGLSHFMKRLPFTSNLNILESEAKISRSSKFIVQLQCNR